MKLHCYDQVKKIDPSGDLLYNLPKNFLVLEHQLPDQWERLVDPEDLFISIHIIFSILLLVFS